MWKRLLAQSFAVDHVTTVAKDQNAKIDWTIFRKMGFSLAYPFFPMGLARHSWLNELDLLPHLEQLKTQGLDLTRVVIREPPIPSLASYAQTELLPITCITNLAAWHPDAISKDCRLKLRKAERSGLSLRPARVEDAAALYQLYRASVTRKGGAIRYTQQYFVELTGTSIASEDLHVDVVELRGETAGFIATLHHRNSAYYLHGGYADHARHTRPGYYSMLRAIERAKRSGCDAFDMLASPSRQQGLVRFKESFGGTTVTCRALDIPLNGKGKLLATVLRVVR